MILTASALLLATSRVSVRFRDGHDHVGSRANLTWRGEEKRREGGGDRSHLATTTIGEASWHIVYRVAYSGEHHSSAVLLFNRVFLTINTHDIELSTLSRNQGQQPTVKLTRI